MCFSAEASFTSATFLMLVGLCTLRKVTNKRMLPFALLPVLFALQQGLEGLVWLAHKRPDQLFMEQVGSYGFLIFAYIIWPLWVPLSVYLLERESKRINAIAIAGIIGCFVALMSIYDLAKNGPGVSIQCNHILYKSSYCFFSSIFPNRLFRLLDLAGYTIAVIAPFFISSVPRMWWFGVIISAGWVIAQIFYAYAFGSIWCFIGAAGSAVVYFIIQKLRS